MLQAIRKRQKFLLTVFITLISIVFVFWGFYGGGIGNLSRSEVASVNGDTITLSEFQWHYQNTVRVYMDILKDKFTPETENRFNLRQLTLNQLIEQKLISQGAQQLGIAVADEEVREQIVGSPYFKKNDQFNEHLYREILRINRLTPALYEENLRTDILQRKVAGVLRDHLKVTPEEALQDYILSNDRINVEFVLINPNPLKTSIPLSADEIKTFSEKKENIEKAQNHYTQNNHLYIQQPQVRARHILIKADEKADAAAKQAARKKAEEILAKTKSEAFEKLAETYSQDEGSAAQGGDLGYFERDKMVKPFEAAAFSLKKGEISGIVESPFGFHIIKVENIKPELRQTFQEVRDEILKEQLLNEKQNNFARSVADELWKFRTSEIKLNAILSRHQLKWDETGLFSRSARTIPKIGEADEIRKAAFALKKNKAFAEQYFNVDNRFFIIRLKKRQDADLKKFETDKEQFVQNALNRKQAHAFSQWLEELRNNSKINIRRDVIEPPEL